MKYEPEKIKSYLIIALKKIFIILIIISISITFIFLSSCKYKPTEKSIEKKSEETAKEITDKTNNKKETEDEEDYVITESKYFELPNKIIIYNEGEKTIIEKDNESYNKIIYTTDKRFERGRCLIEEIIPEEMIEDIKNNKIAIEFIYTEEIQTNYTCEGFGWKKIYTKILFPLPDCRAIFGDEEEYQAGPWYISIQPESDYLISIVEETTEEIVSDPEFKEVIKNIIEYDFGGKFTELIYDENNNTFYLAYNSKWYGEDTIKKEIFDVVSLFAPNNYYINLNIVVTTGFGESHHFYTKTDILIKIKNYEISYEEWLDEAFLK